MDEGSTTAEGMQIIEESRRLTRQLLKRTDDSVRYITQKELGRGAMGVINVVFDQDLKRISAMKVIQPQLIEMDRRFGAFITEARLTAQLEHPNIVPIHEMGMVEATGTPYYTMKLVEGEPLSNIIEKLKTNDPAYLAKYNRHALLNIFRSLCHAIAYAHARDVIHRDIKPENVMIGRFGEVLVMDWGIAKYLQDEDAPVAAEKTGEPLSSSVVKDILKTQDGMIKGSPAYMSPEQAFGEVEAVDKRTDIFLLGSTLYHLFTYCAPYEGTDIMQIVELAERCDVPRPNQRNPACKIPLALERIIVRAMAPLKESRYATVEEMIEDIDAFITGRRVSGRKLFSPGQDLIVGGEKTSECYIIVAGRVEVHREVNGRKMTIAVAGPGEIIGEMAGITQTQSSANVTALESTDTLVITHELITEELQKLPPWLEQIVISLTNRVKYAFAQKDPVLKEIDAFLIVNQLYQIFHSARDLKMAYEKNSYALKDIIDEIALAIGPHRTAIENVISTLVDAGFAAFNANHELTIVNFDEYRMLVAYSRVKLGVPQGMKRIQVPQMHLSVENEMLYQRVVRKLAKAVVKK